MRERVERTGTRLSREPCWRTCTPIVAPHVDLAAGGRDGVTAGRQVAFGDACSCFASDVAELAPPPPHTLDARDALHGRDLRRAAPEAVAGATAARVHHDVGRLDPRTASDAVVHVRNVRPVAGFEDLVAEL